jgi:hypothetical protein
MSWSFVGINRTKNCGSVRHTYDWCECWWWMSYPPIINLRGKKKQKHYRHCVYERAAFSKMKTYENLLVHWVYGWMMTLRTEMCPFQSADPCLLYFVLVRSRLEPPSQFLKSNSSVSIFRSTGCFHHPHPIPFFKLMSFASHNWWATIIKRNSTCVKLLSPSTSIHWFVSQRRCFMHRCIVHHFWALLIVRGKIDIKVLKSRSTETMRFIIKSRRCLNNLAEQLGKVSIFVIMQKSCCCCSLCSRKRSFRLQCYDWNHNKLHVRWRRDREKDTDSAQIVAYNRR